MFVQKFYKGVTGLSRLDVESVLRVGLPSNKLRLNPSLSVFDASDELTEDGLYRHVTDYSAYGPNSPFISLTAGTRETTETAGLFTPLSAWARAMSFATRGNRQPGTVFEGWVIVLGTQSWHALGVAEDIRDRHLYPRFNRFWRQGEVTAKVLIPPEQLTAGTLLAAGGAPIETITNPSAIDPAQFSNIREVI